MGSHIAQVIDGQNYAGMEFVLEAKVHLHRTRGYVIGGKEVSAGNVDPIGQDVAHVHAVGLRASGLHRCLILLLQLN